MPPGHLIRWPGEGRIVIGPAIVRSILALGNESLFASSLWAARTKRDLTEHKKGAVHRQRYLPQRLVCPALFRTVVRPHLGKAGPHELAATNPIGDNQLPFFSPSAPLSLDSSSKVAIYALLSDKGNLQPGAHPNGMFGPRYVVIGTAIGESPANGIGQPEAGTLESRLTAAPGPGRFIPTHRSQGLPSSVIADLPTRSGSVKNLTYFPLTDSGMPCHF